MHTNSILVQKIATCPVLVHKHSPRHRKCYVVSVQKQESQDKSVCRTPTLTPPKYVFSSLNHSSRQGYKATPWDSSRGYHYTEGRRNEDYGDSGPEDKELDSELKNSPLRYVHFILAAPLIFRAFLSSV